MRAIQITEFGGPEVLKVSEVPEPVAGDGQVLITVDRAGKGSGIMIGAAKVFIDDDDPDTLTVENFGTYPLRLVNVELETK